MTPPVLELRRLDVRYARPGGDEIVAVHDLSFAVPRGTCYGLVGESGCGKSTVALAVMRRLGTGGRIAGGQVLLHGRDMAGLSPAGLRALRGRHLAMVYQDPARALNPTMTVGRQLSEVLDRHFALSRAETRERVLAMLASVRLPDPPSFLSRFPHQLSGGQQQRIVIAMAFLGEPDLLILDEPTTALDVTVEAGIIDLLMAMRAERGTAMLFISHNLGVVRRLCDRIGVMYAGQIVEEAATAELFRARAHPYTRNLLDCLPRLDAGRDAYALRSIPGQVPRLRTPPEACVFLDRCRHAGPVCTRGGVPALEAARHTAALVRCHRRDEALNPPPEDGIARRPAAPAAQTRLAATGLRRTYRGRAAHLFGPARAVRAVEDVSLTLAAGETLGIVGESGSGKTTLARIIMGLELPESGNVVVLGEDATGRLVEARSRAQVRGTQMVFQNPDATLNPSHTIGFILERAVRKLGTAAQRTGRQATVARLLDLVRLPPEVARLKPGQLSGGQKQRVAIARAFAGEPRIIVADEPTSALDTSVKAAILELLLDVQSRTGTSLVFISHDLPVVRYLADRILVMYRGRAVEAGPAKRIFEPPYHPYTESLLASVPEIDSDRRAVHASTDETDPMQVAAGAACPFAGRCGRELPDGVCRELAPPPRQAADGHVILCHRTLDELRAVPPIFQRHHTRLRELQP